MRILFIRHGDPDYARDSLTEKGRREARLLADRAERLRLGECWMSPLGRAQHTAAYSLERTGKTARVAEWLREFSAEMDLNMSPELQRAYPDARRDGDRFFMRNVVWDMVPAYMTEHPEYLIPDGWRKSEVARCGNMEQAYDWVMGNLDALLSEHGYVREGRHYRVERESQETLTFFCHFGVICAMLSHLWNVSPFALWHGLALLPTSVTEVVTEEREKGTAWFRALRVGDLSHLDAGGEEPSFACRFCEVYGDHEKRH